MVNTNTLFRNIKKTFSSLIILTLIISTINIFYIDNISASDPFFEEENSNSNSNETEQNNTNNNNKNGTEPPEENENNTDSSNENLTQEENNNEEQENNTENSETNSTEQPYCNQSNTDSSSENVTENDNQEDSNQDQNNTNSSNNNTTEEQNNSNNEENNTSDNSEDNEEIPPPMIPLGILDIPEVSLETDINNINPYTITSSPLTITANGDLELDNITLYFKYSDDNSTWIEEKNKTIGEIRKLTNIDETWATLNFLNLYHSPIVVCSYNLPSSSDNPAVVRVSNVTSKSCDIRIQNPGDIASVTPGDVYVIIIEEGAHNLSDGRKIEAHKYKESITAENNNWNVGTSQSYSHMYTNPVVIGQVMSQNDSRWSSFWCSNGNRANPPSATALFTSKHVAEDTDISRNEEIIGYIVIEAGSGDFNEINYEADLGSDLVGGVGTSPPYSYSLGDSYSVGVATHNAMDGGDGGWCVLYGNNPISSNLNIAIDEDMIGGSERSHTTEQVAYWLFSDEGIITSNQTTSWIKWSSPSQNPDTNNPWSWEFDFPYSTGYYEFCSMGQKNDNIEEIPDNADTKCRYILSSSIDSISPYEQTTYPITIISTGDSTLDNITLYYRYSSDNTSWENNWWNNDFSYRKPITLNTSSGSISPNYQILFNITYENKMNNDFSDIRFIDYIDNSTDLAYWIENKNNGNWANIWVEFIHPITIKSQIHVMMYYGNPSAISTSNGSKTFPLFDDFLGTTYNENIWGTNFASNVEISSGTMSMWGNWNTGGHYFATDNSFSNPIIAQAKARITSLTNDMDLSFGFQNSQTTQWWDNPNNVWCIYDSNGGSSANRKEIKTNGVIDADSEVTSIDWETHKIEYLNTGVNWFDSNLGWLNTTRSTYSPFYFSIVGDTDSSLKVYIDYIFLRNYSSELITSSIGLEEEASGQWQKYNNPSNPDTNSPWGWSFNFPDDEGYYQFYSIAADDGNTEEPPSNADTECYFWIPPIETSVNEISPYKITTPTYTIDAISTGGVPNNVTLYYRYSNDNISWNTDTSWWDSSFTRRKPINLYVPSGDTPENYTVLLNISYDNNMQSDFDDIRFIRYNDNSTELDYWIEEKADDSWCKVWVELKDKINPQNRTIAWMYYGNSTVQNNSNGSNTFRLFDDFSGITLDSKWQINANDYTVSDGKLRINIGAVTLSSALSFKLNDNYTLEGLVLYHTTSGGYSGTLSGQSSQYTAGSNGGADATNLYMRSGSYVRRWTGTGSTTGYNCGSSNVYLSTDNTWYILGAEFNPNGVNLSRNRTQLGSFGCGWTKDIKYISLGAFHGSASYNIQDTSYDWVLIRQDTSLEPTCYIGAEDEKTVGWFLWDDPSNPDASNPWSWNFNFPNSSGFYEFYTIGVNVDGTEEIPCIADAKCQYMLDSSVYPISPYEITSSPINISAFPSFVFNNVTLWYRWSDDNNTWGPYPTWWNNSWQYYRKITIDHNKVDKDLINFPVLVKIDSTIAKKCDDGKSIRFIGNDNATELYYEIEKWNNNGYSFVWVNITDISSTSDSTFLMYYNNSDAVDNQNSENVWDSNFKLIQHLDETSGTHYDSTIYNNDCLPQNGVNQNSDGIIDGADEFDGSDDYLLGPSSNQITDDYLQTITFSAWVKHTSSNDNGIISSLKKSATPNTLISLDAGNSEAGNLGFVTRNSINTEDVWLNHDGGYNDGEWHHLVGVVNEQTRTLYVDGVNRNSDNQGMQNVRNNDAEFTIGSFYTPGYGEMFNGLIDEVHVSNIARTSGWINASYQNQKDPLTFLTINDEIKNKENINWTYYQTDENGDEGWNWSFNFPNNTGYYEFYSIGKETDKPAEIAPSSADAICFYNPYTGPVNYTLIINIEGNGSTDPIAGIYSYVEGSSVTVNTSAFPGWEFNHWSGDVSGGNDSVNITMDGDKTIVANFSWVPIYYSLNVSIIGNGSTDPVVGVYSYLEGSVVTINASADSGWEFSNWSGDASGSNNSINITMDCDKSVVANFSWIPVYYSLNISVNGNGSTDPVVDVYSYLEGSVVTINASADPGWEFSHWSGDASGSNVSVNVTMDGNKSVVANFSWIPIYYSLNISVIGNGSTDPTVDEYSYLINTKVTVNASADLGWNFIGWIGDVVGTSESINITMDCNKSITALFIFDCYNLNIVVEGNGSVSKTPDLFCYLYGSVVELNASADLGWEFSSWSGDASGSNVSVNVTMDGNKSVVANFSKIIDLEKPSNITGLTVTDAKDGKLDISWNAATDNIGIDHYEVHRNGILSRNITGTSFQDTGLSNGDSYSYQISAVDFSGNKGNLSTSVSGIPTKSDSQDPPGPGPGTSSVTIQNIPPVANAGGPYNGFINEKITFDASESNDPDGTTIRYRWDFDDDNEYDTDWLEDATIDYVFSNQGEYNITLQVKDIYGEKDTNKAIAKITIKENNPPSNLKTEGPTNGKINNEYNYTAIAIDIDNSDLLRYIFNWSDSTNDTVIENIESNKSVNATHIWNSYGIYEIMICCEDLRGAQINKTIIILIDVIVIDKEIKGQLIDENSDGIFDLFYNYEDEDSTPVETQDNNSYLIDSDEDDSWDYQYNIETKELVEYKEDKGSLTKQEQEDTFDLSMFGIISLIIALILLFFIFVLYKNTGGKIEEPGGLKEPKTQITDTPINKKVEMEKIREEIIPKIDEMELKTYKTKQKDPIYRWKEQMRFEKISTQIIVNDKSKKSNSVQKKPDIKKPIKSNKNIQKKPNSVKPNKTNKKQKSSKKKK